jgi:CBS domain-containing protein
MREQKITQTRIRHLKWKMPLCVQRGTTALEVLRRMQNERQSCVLVCDGEQCTGIFTERDYLNKIVGKRVDLSKPVDEFMSSSPKVLTTEDTLGQAIQIMHDHGYRNIPLVDQTGNCAGLLQIRNVIDFLAEIYPQEVLNTPPRPDQRFDEPDGA